MKLCPKPAQLDLKINIFALSDQWSQRYILAAATLLSRLYASLGSLLQEWVKISSFIKTTVNQLTDWWCSNVEEGTEKVPPFSTG